METNKRQKTFSGAVGTEDSITGLTAAGGRDGDKGKDWRLSGDPVERQKYILENQVNTDVTFVFKNMSASRATPRTPTRRARCAPSTPTPSAAPSRHARNAPSSPPPPPAPTTRETAESVKAHKFMLMSVSEVFEAQFYGPMREQSDVMTIDDVRKEDFWEMLRFVYHRETTLSIDNILQVLYCAKKCLIHPLIEVCRAKFKDLLDVNNVGWLYEAVFELDPESGEESLKFIDEHLVKVVETDEFLKIQQTSLKKIVERDSLQEGEMEIYNACTKWAEAQCQRDGKEITQRNVRETLGEDIVGAIRFTNMRREDFDAIVIAKPVLTESEIQNNTPHPDLPRMNSRSPALIEEIFQNMLTRSMYEKGDQGDFEVTLKVKDSCRKIILEGIFFVQPWVMNRLKGIVVRGVLFEAQITPDFLDENRVWKATLNNPICLESGEKLHIRFKKSSGGNFQCFKPRQAHVTKYVEISGDEPFRGFWFSLVGLKCRVHKF